MSPKPQLDHDTMVALYEVATAMLAGETKWSQKQSIAVDTMWYGTQNMVTRQLASYVETLSQGKRTVRRADPALFKEHASSISLYLVVCDINTPDGIVTELHDGMSLFGPGPYDTVPATPAQIAEYRALMQRNDARAREQAPGEVRSFTRWLARAVTQSVGYDGDVDVNELTLDDLAAMCLRYGCQLRDVAEEGLLCFTEVPGGGRRELFSSSSSGRRTQL